MPVDPRLELLKRLAEKHEHVSPEEVRKMIRAVSRFTKDHLVAAGFDSENVRKICTKLRDAGRRSPPWRSASSKVPGLPQDGADGNRQRRWDFPPAHEFYADEVTATFVEIKYYLELLSMKGAPPLPPDTIQDGFLWLTGHQIKPGAYLDPIQLVPIELKKFLDDRRYVESGHLIPHGRKGRHVPKNAFLCLRNSNRLQGDLTVSELLELMEQIVNKHKELGARDITKRS